MLKILVRASQCCHIAASSYSLHTKCYSVSFKTLLLRWFLMLFHNIAASTYKVSSKML